MLFRSGGHDPADARLVGSLWLLESTHRLCEEHQAFVRGLEAELLILQDTVLDAPDACRLLAALLHETPLDVQMLESLVWQTVPPDNMLRDRLLAELRAQEQSQARDMEDDNRRNRFERTDHSPSAAYSHAY